MKLYNMFIGCLLLILLSVVASSAAVEEDKYCEHVARSEASFASCVKAEEKAKRKLAKLRFSDRHLEICTSAITSRYASYQGLYNCIYGNMVGEQLKTEVESVLPPTASREEIERELQKAMVRVQAYMQAQQYED